MGRDGGHEKIPKVSLLCHSGGSQLEDFLKEIFSSSSVTSRRCPDGHLLQFALPFGTANIPKNVINFDVFYGALILLFIFGTCLQVPEET